jgi:hypothetical protein
LIRAAAACALCAVAGCADLAAIKAYPGGSRDKAEIGIVQTHASGERFIVQDNRIAAVDGVRYEKGGYEAHMLPGQHRIDVQGTMKIGLQTAGGGPPTRSQYCAFDLNVLPSCTYRAAIPPYPREQIEARAAEWRMTRGMTVFAECSDTSYTIQVPLECSSRP